MLSLRMFFSSIVLSVLISFYLYLCFILLYVHAAFKVIDMENNDGVTF